MNSRSANLGFEQPKKDLSAFEDRFIRHVSAQLSLCGRLQDIADALPEDVDVRECMLVSRSVEPLLIRAHRFEENLVFPALIFAFAENESVLATLERLRREHREDEGYAGELREDLAKFVSDRENCNIGSLAYMMRGFFFSLRRHVAFERDFLLPLLTKPSPET